jgi:hypothetical protein
MASGGKTVETVGETSRWLRSTRLKPGVIEIGLEGCPEGLLIAMLSNVIVKSLR